MANKLVSQNLYVFSVKSKHWTSKRYSIHSTVRKSTLKRDQDLYGKINIFSSNQFHGKYIQILWNQLVCHNFNSFAIKLISHDIFQVYCFISLISRNFCARVYFCNFHMHTNYVVNTRSTWQSSCFILTKNCNSMNKIDPFYRISKHYI